MMRSTFLLIFVFLNLIGHHSIAQEKVINTRFKGGRNWTQKFSRSESQLVKDYFKLFPERTTKLLPCLERVPTY